ncbi:MAG: hypothetical protein J6V72_01540 [Kiritimatiellae bacterium]|nr:hypothetical protein [Kiritimatiellia bacterium]
MLIRIVSPSSISAIALTLLELLSLVVLPCCPAAGVGNSPLSNSRKRAPVAASIFLFIACRSESSSSSRTKAKYWSPGFELTTIHAAPSRMTSSVL